MVRIYLETYGCTLNQSDSDVIKKTLEKAGHQIVPSESFSDVVVLNTCTVKGATENKIIERIKSLNKKKPLVIAGCLSVNEKLLKKIAPNSPIVGTSSISSISDAIEDALQGQGKIYKSREDKTNLDRSFSGPIIRIPICEGCTSNCYFCQTKLARPFLFSYAPKTIIRWIEDGLKQGAREVQLTAMDSGVYGLEISKTSTSFRTEHRSNGLDLKIGLVELLHYICEIDGKFFVRLGMINPYHAKRLGNFLADALMNDKMYKFLHLPVQTGSERVCKEMNRQHNVNDFIQVVEAMRKRIPEITIATDIIVGYPTEREKDFEETLQLVRRIKPDIVNISKFSPRDGTVAKNMKQLPTQVLAKRSRELTKLVKETSAKKNLELIGKTFEVIITEKQQKHYLKNMVESFTGRTRFYKQVVIRNFKGKLGDLVKVKIEDANHGSLFGIVI